MVDGTVRPQIKMKNLKQSAIKVLLFCVLIALGGHCFAQRIAVLEFSAGTGVSLGDVDGLSSIFITYFNPEGYTLVERSQIDKVIEEQNFQKSSLTEQQMVRIGQILNLSKIVIGKINVIMGEYNVDVRVVNCENGSIAATIGDSFAQGVSYRESMKGLAVSLAKQISLRPISESTAQPIDPNSLPPSIVSKFKNYPDDFDIAITYKKELYFLSENDIPELMNYYSSKFEVWRPFAVVLEGGENAIGIQTVNAVDGECDYSVARAFESCLINDRAANIISQNLDRINEIIKMIKRQPMQSIYWARSQNCDNIGSFDVNTGIISCPNLQDRNFYKHHKYLLRIVFTLREMRETASRG